MASITRAARRVSTARLVEIRQQLQDGRQHQRGADGLEVPHYVLPISPQESMAIVDELISLRSAIRSHNIEGVE